MIKWVEQIIDKRFDKRYSMRRDYFDLCFVAYDPAKWIDICINAIHYWRYDHKKLAPFCG